MQKSEKEDEIKNFISYIIDEFIKTKYPSYKQGGLLIFAYISKIFQQNEIQYLESILPPIFLLINDADPRIRYSAAESLCNVIKVAEAKILTYFNEIFDIICALLKDKDNSAEVKNISFYN